MSTYLRKFQSSLVGLIARESSPETHLAKTLLFWSAILTPISIGATLILYTSIKEGYTLSITTSGFANFLELYKLPLGIMGASIPLGALVAAIHRSFQTSRQIIEQRSQNIFSNHLEHRRHFIAYCDESATIKKYNINYSKLYDFLFNDSSEGNLAPSKPSIDLFKQQALLALEMVDREYLPKLSHENISYENYDVILVVTATRQTISSKSGIGDKPVSGDAKIATYDTVRHSLRYISHAWSIITQCANFHRPYIDDEETEKIARKINLTFSKLQNAHHLIEIIEAIHKALVESTLSEGNLNYESGVSVKFDKIDKDITNKDHENLLPEAILQFNKDEIEKIRINSSSRWKEIISRDR